MKTITDYSFYCTPEQTKNALELGAPIESEIEYIFIANQEHVHQFKFNKRNFNARLAQNARYYD